MVSQPLNLERVQGPGGVERNAGVCGNLTPKPKSTHYNHPGTPETARQRHPKYPKYSAALAEGPSSRSGRRNKKISVSKNKKHARFGKDHTP
jgi:hypothetical protein